MISDAVYIKQPPKEKLNTCEKSPKLNNFLDFVFLISAVSCILDGLMNICNAFRLNS